MQPFSSTLRASLALSLAPTALALPQTVQPIVEEAKLVGTSAAPGDTGGSAVAIQGDTLVVGAPMYTPTGATTGLAYVHVRSGATWAEQAQLAAIGGESGDWFGASVGVDGDTVVVGAPQADTGASAILGAAYVFERVGANWAQVDVLTASTPAAGLFPGQFGLQVALRGDTLAVGAPTNLVAGVAAGSVHVFVRSGSTWTEQAVLTSPGPEEYAFFGAALALDGDRLIVGAAGEDTAAGLDVGAAHVFSRAGSVWSPAAELAASDADPYDQFGVSVSIWGSVAVVGANEWLAGKGAAYVYRDGPGGWTEQQKLVAADGGWFDNFGHAVSVGKNVVLVGSPGDLYYNWKNSLGATYAFVQQGTQWVQDAKVVASDLAPGDHFGSSLALAGDSFVTGSPHRDAWTGAAYVHRLTLPEGFVYCTAGTSASGCRARISVTGTASASASSGFDLVARDVEGARDGMFFYGSNGRQAVPWGTGYQCVVPPVLRGGLLQGFGTSPGCDGAFSLDLNARWTAKPTHNPGAGAVVQAQLWFRDPWNTATTKTTTLSDAIEFTVGP